ncbi:hypothetical protein OESDEN_02275 [Oesophagostomum dentatum]|uniref:Uncharacterized protein n=1 Tax=Oesophagostomum dentatum TaxID=61180 RepID=A0A0B1TPJ5_OESDE|nr:hypothetical protein OESDEN_02275 [Oesophagostomum dentatum]
MSPFSTTSIQYQPLLPRLQIPKFSGRRQEWDTFWAIFKDNVGEQPIPAMIKFNYLLQALVGEARHTAAQFQVTEGNCQLVVEALIKKYGRDTSIVEDLLQQLEMCKAEGTNTKQRSHLLELITAILTQLTVKGQDVNQRLVLNLILRKFNSDIQIKALERRERLNSIEEWTWPVLQKDLSDIIDTKEKIERAQEAVKRSTSVPTINRTVTQGKRSVPTCIYCKWKNHRSSECRTVRYSNTQHTWQGISYALTVVSRTTQQKSVGVRDASSVSLNTTHRRAETNLRQQEADHKATKKDGDGSKPRSHLYNQHKAPEISVSLQLDDKHSLHLGK